MSPLEYLGQALDQWPLYGLLALLFLVVHAVLVRRWAVGIFDPLTILLLSNALGWAIVWFMFLRGDIPARHAGYFTAAQLAFYAGIELGHRFRPAPGRTGLPGGSIGLMSTTLWISGAVHVLATLAMWALAGIPLLRESRLGAFQGSGGFGIVERLSDACALIAVFAAALLLMRRPRGLRDAAIYLLLAWLLVSTALSGSKSALFTFGQYLLSIAFVYGTLRHRSDWFWGGRAGKLLLVAGTLFAIGVLATQQEGDFGLSALRLVYRIVSYGDVYIFAYVDATIDALRGDDVLAGLFGGFLSTFRLFPQDWVPVNLGFQLAGIVFPDLEVIVGPNPQHPVFGYHYFGGFGVLFSLVLGLLTITAQHAFFFRRHRSFVSALLAFLLYFIVVSISGDFQYTMSRVASVILGLVVVFVPVFLLHPQAVLLRPRTLRMPARPAGPLPR